MAELVQCFHNPNANNQVMAVYTDCTTSNPEAWANQGYIECIVPKAHHGAVMSMGRHCVLTFEGNELVLVQPNTNPEETEHEQSHAVIEAAEQAAEDRLQMLEARLAALENV